MTVPRLPVLAALPSMLLIPTITSLGSPASDAFAPIIVPAKRALGAATKSLAPLRLSPDGSPRDERDDDGGGEKFWSKELGSDLRRAFLASAAAAVMYNVALGVVAPPGFRRVPTQFIAALGDPDASSGSGAEGWGLWSVDPGPRGVRLSRYDDLEGTWRGTAPAGWEFDGSDWWLEEHGIIMERPDFPLAPGRYLVTGGRLVTTILTIFPPEETGGGSTRWKLDSGRLCDVTHLPCRAARYRPNAGRGSPASARRDDFPVAPGAAMPEVDGCNKVDYAVLFVIGVEG